MKLTIELPWPSKRLSPNKRQHWAQKAAAAKSYRRQCHLIAIGEINKTGWKLPQSCTERGSLHLWIDFYPPDRRRRDDDNVAASFKAGRDGLADAIGCDDSIFRTHPFLNDETVKGGAVVVTITTSEQQGAGQ